MTNIAPIQSEGATFDPPLMLIERYRRGELSREATGLGLKRWGWSRQRIKAGLKPRCGPAESIGLATLGATDRFDPWAWNR